MKQKRDLAKSEHDEAPVQCIQSEAEAKTRAEEQFTKAHTNISSWRLYSEVTMKADTEAKMDEAAEVSTS